MSVSLYIDNEVPDMAQWDQLTEIGTAAIDPVAEAAFPERGSVGLRAGGTGTAYVTRLLEAQSPLQVRYAGLWVRLNAVPVPGSAEIIRLGGASRTAGILLLADQAALAYNYSSGQEGATLFNAPQTGRWTYLVLAVCRASSPSLATGWVKLYVNGRLVVTAANLFNHTAAGGTGAFSVGRISGGGFAELDTDEVKIQDDAYPAPFTPTPPSPHVCPQRLCVVYSASHGPSRDFADACVSLGVPRSHLIDVAYPGASETLADYPAVVSSFETPIRDFLDRHPAVRANCLCLLVGPHLPNAFMHQGARHSLASRLMGLYQTFTPNQVNPLSALPLTGPLTAADLGGRLLACQVDGPTASTLMSDGAAAVAVPPGSRLVGGTDAFRRSLGCAALRLDAGPLTPPGQVIEDDTFLLADRAGLTLGTSALRVAMLSTAAGAGSSLRTPGSDAYAALQAGYRAVLAGAGASQAFDVARFLTMLRLGGSVVEAAAVACPTLDSGAMIVANPLLGVRLPRGGLNVYAGPDSIENVNWSAPVAMLGATQDQVQVDLPLTPGRLTVLAGRRVSDDGIEEHGTGALAYVCLDETGQAYPPVLSRATDLRGVWLEDGAVELHWRFETLAGEVPPEWMEVLGDRGDGQFDPDQPLACAQFVPGRREYRLTLAAGAVAARLAIRACRQNHLGPLCGALELARAAVPAPQLI